MNNNIVTGSMFRIGTLTLSLKDLDIDPVTKIDPVTDI